ncbi:MAG TPA: recombinase family protein [Syntrophorhabdaceae bacterium]|nr:recombinase family protein [Syntrophorhabdaceae bacterium]
MKRIAIYARVSTDRQSTESQLNALREYAGKRAWAISKEYIDEGYTGSNTKRPAFTAMMADAKKRKFDVLLVYKLDRLSRSLKDLITTLDDLKSMGIDFISYDNGLDTTTPTGRLIFNVVGAVAEFEKDIIRERVRAGLENAKRKGKRLGRPPVSSRLVDEAKKLRSEGMSFRQIGKQLGIPESTIRANVNL